MSLRTKLRVLALARRIGNVTEACRRLGISRSHFYNLRERFAARGVDGLKRSPRSKPRMPNETPPSVVDVILAASLRFPTYSYLRLSRRITAGGVPVSCARVRGVWRRHGLSTTAARLAWLELAGGRLSARHRQILGGKKGGPRRRKP